MAGLKAGMSAATWPDINGQYLPSSMNELSPWTKNLANNPIMVQFIHRSLAYLLVLLVFVWWLRSSSLKNNRLFRILRGGLLAIVLIQVSLGIATVLNATYPDRLVWLGVMHQFVAMLLLLTLLSLIYLFSRRPVS